MKNLEKGLTGQDATKAIANALQLIFIDDTVNYQSYVNFALSLITIAVPEIGILTPFIGLFFAALNKNSATPPSATDIFQAMQPAIQAMIDKSLETEELKHLNDAAAELRGALSAYQDEMDTIQGLGGFDKVDQATKDLFWGKLIDVDTFFRVKVPVFIQPNPQFPDLVLISAPYYTMFASMHLIFLRDIIYHGQTWNAKKFTQGVNGVSGSLDAYKIDLKKLIKTYSKNIHDIFNQGLQRYGDSFNDTVQFRKKQQYIEIMTTHCLDFARLFPTFDPDLYPIGSSGINLQKTRRLLSPILPIREFDVVSIDTSKWPDYNNGLLPDPNKRVLKKVTLYPYYGSRWDPNRNILWAVEIEDSFGTQLYGTIPPDSSSIDTGDKGGAHPIPIDPSNPVVDIYMYSFHTNGEATIQFTMKDGTQYKVGWVGSLQRYEIPGAHYLSYLYEVDYTKDDDPKYGYGRIGRLVGVSTPQEAMGENYIGIPDEDGNLSGMGFAWENGDIDNGIGSLQVVKETITGTNVVKLNYQQIVRLPIQNKTKLSYNVRIHYASKNEIKGFFHIYTGSDDLLKGEVTFPSTETDDVQKMVAVQGDNGKYALHVFETPVTLPVGQFTAYIQNNSTEDFYLDRIEFVPVTSDDNLPDITIPFHANLSIQPGESQTIWKSPGSRVGISTDFTTHVLSNFVGFAQYYKSGEPLDRSSMGDLSDHVQKSISTGFDEIRIMNAGEVGTASIVGTVSGSIDLSSNNNPGNNPNDTVTIDTSFDVSRGDTQIIWTAPQSKLGVSTKFQLDLGIYSTIELHYLKSGVIQQPIGVYSDDDQDNLIQDSVPTGFDQIEVYNSYDFYNHFDNAEGSLKGTISFASNSSRNTFVFLKNK
ncbi:insecticidal delta-endotoxin Cry8Ea1 family protein [Bacillus cereus]|uniref:Crystaline entomocidal protoxin n=2 Tax=Bacillus cereus group TaxID=86661 RepID=A0A9W5KR77_BACCE|nr:MULTISPECIES: insecticidal delta-endotoxin Cry8Ea1 family protein [Bacillus cereus group]MEB8748737.1 insecticidal delta-endotoxin Cry8Ea1 family protein [Bacillus cereus]EEM44256.1 Pesticidal crystal protein cry5Aa [Bacillus thuringiensis serovar pakistani str. T13001]EJR62419.1 hypothetical protein IK5_05920 [Bacillus cereus VD154]KIU74504.1 hypothetical protein C797_12066 [Bacillus thuringiensis Sbt003]MEB8763115.1 insecticidal delta-endotoxin Cry8Ea1 family protein [Bacillus cereus]